MACYAPLSHASHCHTPRGTDGSWPFGFGLLVPFPPPLPTTPYRHRLRPFALQAGGRQAFGRTTPCHHSTAFMALPHFAAARGMPGERAVCVCLPLSALCALLRAGLCHRMGCVVCGSPPLPFRRLPFSTLPASTSHYSTTAPPRLQAALSPSFEGRQGGRLPPLHTPPIHLRLSPVTVEATASDGEPSAATFFGSLPTSPWQNMDRRAHFRCSSLLPKRLSYYRCAGGRPKRRLPAPRHAYAANILPRACRAATAACILPAPRLLPPRHRAERAGAPATPLWRLLARLERAPLYWLPITPTHFMGAVAQKRLRNLRWLLASVGASGGRHLQDDCGRDGTPRGSHLTRCPQHSPADRLLTAVLPCLPLPRLPHAHQRAPRDNICGRTGRRAGRAFLWITGAAMRGTFYACETCRTRGGGSGRRLLAPSTYSRRRAAPCLTTWRRAAQTLGQGSGLCRRRALPPRLYHFPPTPLPNDGTYHFTPL